MLTRERSRIDRSGGVMSLIVFHVPKRRWFGRRKMRRLVAVLAEQLRISDEVGIIDQGRAFALLPDTEALGAEVLARRLQRHLIAEGMAVNFAVFRYASGQNRGSDDNARNQNDRRKPPGGSGGASGDSTTANGKTSNWDDIPPPLRIASVGLEEEAMDTKNAEDRAACLVSTFAEHLPWWKRGLDLAIASTAMVIALPVLLVAAAAIRLEGPGPIFFKQQRMGAGRRPFSIYKLRTMVVDAERRRDDLVELNEQDGPAFKIRHDPRITRVGRFLRASSLDELPQLINVLRGDMTLVGPRPLPVHEAEACDDWHDARHSVHPGLTCIWQVTGRSRVSFDDWARMDLAYISRRSVWRDLKILFATLPAVLRGEGAS
ncbi:MAG: sugar transferase [Planctomycetota bacterium]